MKPGLLAGLLVLALVGIGLLIFVVSGDSSDTDLSAETANLEQPAISQPPANLDPEIEAEIEQSQVITSEELALRSTAEECWTSIDGIVYDITQYVPRHPGGSEILLACGTDGSSLFNNRTTASGETVGSGTPHSSGASSQLSEYRIGTLAN